MIARNSSSVRAEAARVAVSLGSALATIAGVSGAAGGALLARAALAAALSPGERPGTFLEVATRSTGTSPTATSTPTARYHSSAAKASASLICRSAVIGTVMSRPAAKTNRSGSRKTGLLVAGGRCRLSLLDTTASGTRRNVSGLPLRRGRKNDNLCHHTKQSRSPEILRL